MTGFGLRAQDLLFGFSLRTGSTLNSELKKSLLMSSAQGSKDVAENQMSINHCFSVTSTRSRVLVGGNCKGHYLVFRAPFLVEHSQIY